MMRFCENNVLVLKYIDMYINFDSYMKEDIGIEQQLYEIVR